MFWHNLDNCGVLLQNSNCLFQNDLLEKLELKLKISIDISCRKKKNINSYSRIPNQGAPECNIDELSWVSSEI